MTSYIKKSIHYIKVYGIGAFVKKVWQKIFLSIKTKIKSKPPIKTHEQDAAINYPADIHNSDIENIFNRLKREITIQKNVQSSNEG